MSLRFGLNTLFAVAGGFLVVASTAFASDTGSWLAFAVSTGVTVLAAAALARRPAPARGYGYAASFTVGLWSLIAALVFSGATLSWLIVADALALVAISLADLIAHEVRTERVVHTLDVRQHAQATV